MDSVIVSSLLDGLGYGFGFIYGSSLLHAPRSDVSNGLVIRCLSGRIMRSLYDGQQARFPFIVIHFFQPWFLNMVHPVVVAFHRFAVQRRRWIVSASSSCPNCCWSSPTIPNLSPWSFSTLISTLIFSLFDLRCFDETHFFRSMHFLTPVPEWHLRLLHGSGLLNLHPLFGSLSFVFVLCLHCPTGWFPFPLLFLDTSPSALHFHLFLLTFTLGADWDIVAIFLKCMFPLHSPFLNFVSDALS